MTRDQATLLRLLQRHPRGITLVDLMLTLGRTQSACVSDLHALQEAGEAGSVRASDAAPVWAARSDLQALRDAQAAKRSTPKPARLTAQEQQAESALADEFIERRPVRRRLEQNDWAGRVTIPGPSSVFNL